MSSNTRYILNQGHPFLEVDLDGKTYRIDSEQKPNQVRAGLPAVPGSPYVATVLCQEMRGVSDDPELFRLIVAFGLDVYHGRFEEGPASSEIDPVELRSLGERLAPYDGLTSPD